MRIAPLSFLLATSLAFAQTTAVDQVKGQAKAEVKTKADKAVDKAGAKVDQKTQGKAADQVGKAKDTAKAKVAGAVGEVVASRESKVFHKPACRLAGRIKAENRIGFASPGAAAKDGYQACKICKP